MGNEHTRSMWDQHVEITHLRGMAENIWGADAQAMMAEFQPSESLLMKYQHNIVNSDRALRGKRVLDMGCNHGLYSYLAMRHGAAHVVGIEPRGMFVNGLNRFAEQNDLPMQFHRGYDTDMARLLREHDIDTVIMMSLNDTTNWENMMYDVRKSDAEWLIMQVTTLPDTWVEFSKEIYDHAKTGSGMPVGFTLHYETFNSDTRAGINPMHKDTADPETGFQHVRHDGKYDLKSSHVIQSLQSRQYIRKFIDHVGFKVESSVVQPSPLTKSPSRLAASGLYQWYLLRNEK